MEAAEIVITYDNTAAVYEVWKVAGDDREWLGVADTRAEARDLADKAA